MQFIAPMLIYGRTDIINYRRDTQKRAFNDYLRQHTQHQVLKKDFPPCRQFIYT